MSATVIAEPVAQSDDEPPADEVAGRWQRWRPDLAVYAGFLVLATWLLWPLWKDPAGLGPADNGSDPQFFQWALVHASRIFTHGENPFFSPQLNAPLGVNMMANTGLLGMTVPLTPVTLIFGAPVAFVLLLTLGIAATASTWYWVLSRHVVPGCRTAAIVGGAFCGFAPGMVNHLNAHPNLVSQFLIPLILWRALDLRRSGPVLRRAVILALLVTWQAFLNEELLFLYALAALIFVAAYAALRPQTARAAAWPLLRGLAVAGAIVVVLLAYPLYFQFLGPQHYRGLPDWLLAYGTDLGEYPAFAKLSLVDAEPKLGHMPEQNTFYGWPLLLLLLAVIIYLRRRVEAVALTVVLAVFVVLSLGHTAVWRGKELTSHTPWGLLNGLPLFDTVLPSRLGLITVPVIGLLLALGLAAALSRPVPTSHLWVAAFAVGLVTIFPQQLGVSPAPAVPHFISAGGWRSYVTGDASVLSADTSVWNGGINAMAWGVAADQGYRVVGGYYLGPGPDLVAQYGTVNRPTAGILNNIIYNGGTPAIGDAERAQAAQDVRYWHTAIVILADGTAHYDELSVTLTGLFGAGVRVDDVMLWDVRALSRT
jgi:hypothetical protein